MDAPSGPDPSPGSKVRVRVAGRPEISEGTVERFAETGVLLRLTRAPDLGMMTLIEFLGSDDTVALRRTACMVFRRGGGRGSRPTSVALEFVDLVGGEERPRSWLSMLARLFGRTPSSPPSLRDQLDLPALTRTGPVVGIDLGTVNSCIAVHEDGQTRVLEVRGRSTLPSVVHFETGGRRTVGELARQRMVLEPTRSVFGSKRFLGRPFASSEVRRWGHFFPYQLVQGSSGSTAVKIGHELHPLEEVAKEILSALKTQAEGLLREKVHRAVISVPAYFGEPEREAVRTAGHWAGLYVERLVNEPTAAAVAYGHRLNAQQRILVYDLGGGTFDVSVLEVAGAELKVLSTGGDPFLGGADFDDRLTEFVISRFESEHPEAEVRRDPVAVQRVRFAAEAAKLDLSSQEQVEVRVDQISTEPPASLAVEVTRRRFQDLVGDLVDRTLVITDGVLRESGLLSSDIDEVVLVGGQTRSPVVRERLHTRFGDKISRRVHPDEAVAIGAAIVGTTIDGATPIVLHDILAAAIQWSVGSGSRETLFAKGTSLPAEAAIAVAPSVDGGQVLRLYRGEEETEAPVFIGSLELPEEQDADEKVHVSLNVEGLLSCRLRRGDDDPGEVLTLSLMERG
ncbi:MAG: Hsp70 family protein [Myxococcota bacterium]